MSHQTKKIHQVPRREILRHKWGNTADIMREIVSVCSNEALVGQVYDFAQQFRGKGPAEQYEGLRRLWEFSRFEIDYEVDPDGYQFIKHPGRTWWDNQKGDGSDCKSLTVFIYFCCRAIDVPCFIRFASYDADKEIRHVYPVAVLPEYGEVVVDAVFDKFDAEARNITKQIDKRPTGWNATTQTVAAIAGDGTPSENPLKKWWATSKPLEKIFAAFLAGMLLHEIVLKRSK